MLFFVNDWRFRPFLATPTACFGHSFSKFVAVAFASLKICKCSQDTAIRSIKYMMDNKILKQIGAGRSTHYVIDCGE